MPDTTTIAPATDALRALTRGVVDYAGLFPPASLPMDAAVASYADYRGGPDAWMLGRFVVPVARLQAWETAVQALTPAQQQAWHGARLSALLSGEFAQEAAQLQAFNARAPFGVLADAVEGKAHTPDAVLAMAAAMPDGVTLYCELPHQDDPQPFVDAVRAAQVRAKIRTGGVTPDAFPTPEQIVRFLRRCHDAGVTAKATAGLHHPLRGDFRLTYAPDAPTGTMYGYLNVFLAAAALRAGAPDDVVQSVLTLRDASQVVVVPEAITVCRVRLGSGVLEAMRRDGVVAFGSCSFREPVDELSLVGFST